MGEMATVSVLSCTLVISRKSASLAYETYMYPYNKSVDVVHPEILLRYLRSKSAARMFSISIIGSVA